MPELPEVETVAKALNRDLVGRIMDSASAISKLRLPFEADETTARLRGRRVRSVRRRAKYLIVDFEDADCVALMIHLGMTGSLRVEAADIARHPHDRAALLFADGDELRFSDARRFGFMQLIDLPCRDGLPAALDKLGPEPLERRFTGDTLAVRAAGRSCAVKVFVMDQSVVVGVGNIYASEALHAAGVDPRRSAASLSAEEWGAVVREIKAVLRRAIKSGGSTIRDYRGVDGSEGRFQRELRIYGKAGKPCPVCGSDIETVRLGGRSTFYCRRCQT